MAEEGAGPWPNLVNLTDTDSHLDEPWQNLSPWASSSPSWR